jgi:hypothetical protein
MLDASFSTKQGDFGLARLVEHRRNHAQLDLLEQLATWTQSALKG